MTRSSVDAELRTVSRYCALVGRQRRRRAAAPPCRARRSSASGSRGSCWRRTRSWRGSPLRPIPSPARRSCVCVATRLRSTITQARARTIDAGEDADERQRAAGVPERRRLQHLDAALERAPAAGTERPAAGCRSVANCTLQMPRTRSGCPAGAARAPRGVVRESSMRGERRAVGVEDQHRALGRRHALDQARLDLTSCASAAPLARRAGFSVIGATGAARAGPPDPRVLEDQAVGGAGGGEADGLDDVAGVHVGGVPTVAHFEGAGAVAQVDAVAAHQRDAAARRACGGRPAPASRSAAADRSATA